MFTRLSTFYDAERIDDGIAFLRETITPLLHEQRGYAGVTASADRAGKVLGILSLWNTEQDRDASESALSKARDEGSTVVGGTVQAETFEQVVARLQERPRVGSGLLFRRLHVDPAALDEHTAYFEANVLPTIEQDEGFQSLRLMVNRATGDCTFGSAWRDQDCLRAAADKAIARSADAEKRGVTFGELSLRELLYVDLP